MMTIVVALGLFAIAAGWAWYMRRQAVQHPLWMAFGATLISVYLTVTGLAGHTLNRHDRFVSQTSWAGHVIWYQVGLGVVAGGLAVYFWRDALARRAAR
jgi:hypothetical protein